MSKAMNVLGGEPGGLFDIANDRLFPQRLLRYGPRRSWTARGLHPGYE